MMNGKINAKGKLNNITSIFIIMTEINKSSMLWWYPLIKDLPIPQPQTEIVLRKANWWKYLDGKVFPKNDIAKLKKVIERIGMPCFMRTDLASGKHNYLDTCYVGTTADVDKHLFRLIEANALCDLWFNAIIIREFIYLGCKFRAFDGLPIASERRYFIKDGEVICHHPYWIEDAIRFYKRTKDYEKQPWQKWLKEMNKESETEVIILKGYAEKVAVVLNGAWSIDFAKDSEGRWWLIDVALAEQSWHPPCKNKLTGELRGS